METSVLDTVLPLLDRLCRIHSHRLKDHTGGEREMMEYLSSLLRQFSWLTVEIDEVPINEKDEKPSNKGFYNVFAYSGNPLEIRFLVVGHLDTVLPSGGWSVEEFSEKAGRYYALGAIDTKAGIAACLDAIAKAGQTQNIGFLFYSDEETDFYGMKHFVIAHPEVRPEFGLSLCGGHAKAYLGWRGCLEMEFLIKGKSAHASKPDEGANAAEAISYVMETVRQACSSSKTDVKTSANIAAIRAGSAGSAQSFCADNRQAPEMANIANKVPDMAWALLDVRPGGPQVTTSFIQSVAEQALVDWNKVDGRKHKATLKVRINIDMPSYKADKVRIQPLFERFAPVHHGQISELEKTGFLDTTLISSRHGTQFMCLTPAGDNMHAADEYVEIASLLTYRDCLVALLKEHTTS